MTSALTTIETGRLAAYERTIESGLQTFVEVGAALSAIRDSKLYRASYGTFEEYCRERWGMARSTAYQLMEATEVVENVRNCGQIPATESQARPLAKLPAEEQAPAWEEATEAAQAESREVTAKDVERAVSRRTSKPTTPEEEEEMYFHKEKKERNQADTKTEQPIRKGKGMEAACKAIEILQGIPLKDPLRDMGFAAVTKWIKDNR